MAVNVNFNFELNIFEFLKWDLGRIWRWSLLEVSDSIDCVILRRWSLLKVLCTLAFVLYLWAHIRYLWSSFSSGRIFLDRFFRLPIKETTTFLWLLYREMYFFSFVYGSLMEVASLRGFKFYWLLDFKEAVVFWERIIYRCSTSILYIMVA